MFVMELKHQDPNVYNIKPLSGKDLMHTMNWSQLFDLQKSQGDNVLHPAPDIYLPIILTKKSPKLRLPKQVINMVPSQKPKFYNFTVFL